MVRPTQNHQTVQNWQGVSPSGFQPTNRYQGRLPVTLTLSRVSTIHYQQKLGILTLQKAATCKYTQQSSYLTKVYIHTFKRISIKAVE